MDRQDTMLPGWFLWGWSCSYLLILIPLVGSLPIAMKILTNDGLRPEWFLWTFSLIEVLCGLNYYLYGVATKTDNSKLVTLALLLAVAGLVIAQFVAEARRA